MLIGGPFARDGRIRLLADDSLPANSGGRLWQLLAVPDPAGPRPKQRERVSRAVGDGRSSISPRRWLRSSAGSFAIDHTGQESTAAPALFAPFAGGCDRRTGPLPSLAERTRGVRDGSVRQSGGGRPIAATTRAGVAQLAVPRYRLWRSARSELIGVRMAGGFHRLAIDRWQLTASRASAVYQGLIDSGRTWRRRGDKGRPSLRQVGCLQLVGRDQREGAGSMRAASLGIDAAVPSLPKLGRDDRQASGSPFLQDVFSTRRNSIAFLRWLFAVLVVVDHSYPLGGFNHGQGPISPYTAGQASLGDVAVVGFFVLSGFLVTRSRERSASTLRYLWHRVLRIFPGFWVCLLVTAFVLAPIEWHAESGHWSGFLGLRANGPLSYVRRDFLLTMHQWVIGPLLSGTPYATHGGTAAWDGSLWTLIFEFRCYLLVAVVAALSATRAVRRRVYLLMLGLCAVAILVSLESPASVAKVVPELHNFAFVRFLFAFLLGATAYLYADRIPVTREAAAMAALVFVYTLHSGGLYIVGYAAFAYCVLFAAVFVPIYRFDRYGDLSYGIYIYAFPIQMLLSAHDFQRFGAIAYIVTSIVLSTLVAAVSWHLVEKRALGLKDLRWLDLRARRSRAPAADRGAEAVADSRSRQLPSAP